MGKFIERIRDAYNYDYAWENEPLFFKAFMVIAVVPYWLLKLVYCSVVGVTFPLWIVPYAIWWTKKNK